MEKAQLEAIKKGIDNDYAALDVLHAETEHALQELDTPKAQQKYSEEYRKAEKSRVRHEARVKAEEIEKAVLDRVAAKLQSAESHWSLDNMLRSARFIPEPKKPVRGEFMLPSDLEAVTIAYEAQVSMHAASEFFARSTFREDLEFATDDEFFAIVDKAIHTKNLAGLHLARMLARTRKFENDSNHAKAKILFGRLDERLDLPERSTALGLIGECGQRLLDINSTQHAISTGTEDRRRTYRDTMKKVHDRKKAAGQ